MIFEILGKDNVQEYIDYLKIAMSEEPELMTADTVDEEGIKNRIRDPFFNKTTSILAKIGGKVVGRIEYHFYGCIQNGYKMAYVDWVYVLNAYRHQGIAQMLFSEFEADCVMNDINQYYLIRAENRNADRFYGHFADVELSESPILRKHLKQ
ncbi:MAG: GNAT family N-acetyltransferase [Lachnospiraceae bacterium]|nr:GNAT family N-acetyltransferase [Lachnospiraceae bacterium]